MYMKKGADFLLLFWTSKCHINIIYEKCWKYMKNATSILDVKDYVWYHYVRIEVISFKYF